MSATRGDQEFDCYLTHLRTLASSCEFGSLENELILLRIVLDINDNTFRVPDLTLHKAAAFIPAAEQTKKHLKVIVGEPGTVNVVSNRNIKKSMKQLSTEAAGTSNSAVTNASTNYDCRRCQMRHNARN